jgi:biopolymer transport protein ExbD
MKIIRKNHFQAEVSTSSLNDIMFFLLLFFLIISTVTNPNVIKVLLPQSKANQALKQPIILTVTENKQYYINKRPVPVASLEQELAKACEGLSEPTVVIHIPYNLDVQDLVDVMQIGGKQKIKMVLATKNK